MSVPPVGFASGNYAAHGTLYRNYFNGASLSSARPSVKRKAALLQKQNKAYNDFCEENGLKKLSDRLNVAGWNKSQASAASAAERKKNAVKTEKRKPLNYSVFSTYNLGKSDTIRPQSVIKELNKSQIGRELLEYIETENVQTLLCYGIDNPKKYLGVYDPLDDVIDVYCDETKTIKETAATVIHEATHRKLGSRGTFAEEVECYKAEAIHLKGELTQEDIERIIKHVRKNYPELE